MIIRKNRWRCRREPIIGVSAFSIYCGLLSGKSFYKIFKKRVTNNSKKIGGADVANQ